MGAGEAGAVEDKFHRRQIDSLLDRHRETDDTLVADIALLLALTLYLDLPDADLDGIRTILRTRRSPW